MDTFTVVSWDTRTSPNINNSIIILHIYTLCLQCEIEIYSLLWIDKARAKDKTYIWLTLIVGTVKAFGHTASWKKKSHRRSAPMTVSIPCFWRKALQKGVRRLSNSAQSPYLPVTALIFLKMVSAERIQWKRKGTKNQNRSNNELRMWLINKSEIVRMLSLK